MVRSLALLTLLSTSLALSALTAGCPVAGRCAADGDCASGDVCRNGACESLVGVGEGEGEAGEGEGEAGEGEGEGEAGEGEGETGEGEGEGEGEPGIELVVEEGEQDLSVARGQRVSFTIVRGAGVTGACDVNGVAVNDKDEAAIDVVEADEVDGVVTVTATCATSSTPAQASLGLRVLIRAVTATGLGAPGAPVQIDVETDSAVNECTIDGVGTAPGAPFFLYAVTTEDFAVSCSGEPGAAHTTVRIQGRVFIEDVRADVVDGLRFRVAGDPAASCTATRDDVAVPVLNEDPSVRVIAADSAPGSARYDVTCTAPGSDDVVNDDTATVRVLWDDANGDALGALPRDTSRLFVAGNLDLTDVLIFDGTALEGVGGDVTVRTTSLSALSLPALRVVGGAVTVDNNPLLTVIDLPVLASAGAVVVSRNSFLIELDVAGLREVSGALILQENGNSLEGAGLPLVVDSPALLGVGGDLVVIDNHTLPENVVSLLVTQLFEGFGVGGALSVSDNGPPAL